MLLLATLVALLAQASAAAAPPSPWNLALRGGSGWRPDRYFDLTWRNPAVLPPPAAVDYLVRDEAGAVVVGPRHIDWPAEAVRVEVPAVPGNYGFEVWVEDAAGVAGPPASVGLHFDDGRPGEAVPLTGAGWIGRAELPLALRVSHPGGTQPVSGIGGYALSVDRDPDGEPCADSRRCDPDEIDLRGGAGDDRLVVGELPEGVSYAHAVAVSGAGMRSRTTGTAALRVDRTDPVTRLSGVPAEWADGPVVLRATAADGASGMRPDGVDGPFTAIRVDDGPPSVSPGADASATVIGEGTHSISYYARDAAGNVDDGATANGRRNPQPRRALVRIDRWPPSVAFLPSTHPEDPELIEARVVDGLSGPAAGRGRIGVRAAGSGAPFEPLATSAEGAVLRARWSSDDYPPGRYEFEAVGYDRAGNAGIGRRRVGGAPMLLPSPLKAETRLRAGLGTGGRPRLVPAGRRVAFRGRLTLASGSPIAGMQVRVVERLGAGPEGERTTLARTGREGRFLVRLEPGPSREILATFAGTATRARARSLPAELLVRGRVRLAVSSAVAEVGGEPVVFRGRVSGGKTPADGLEVEIQFKLPGLRWAQFRTVRTSSDGRYRYAYRFSDDDSRGARFLFRAYVPAQDDWPYEPGGSLPVAVRGR
jgi:hypothetical protein